MKTVSLKELKEIIENHEKWLRGERGGVCANLTGADLRGANLTGADLENAKLIDADLENANLIGANLTGAELWSTNLSNANLCSTNLTNANLRYANLKNTNLENVNLTGADLFCAKLANIKYNEQTAFFALCCPEEGAFIAYKKASLKKISCSGKAAVIVKILVTEDAKRSSATTRKCRCSKAKVLSITSIDGQTEFSKAYSYRDCNFVYRVGEIVEVNDFDENRWNECSTGIHFFVTRDEAVNY